MKASHAIATKLAGLAITAGAAIGVWTYVEYRQNAPQRIIEDQARQIEYLENVAVRLTGQRRVAKIVVTDQTQADDGQLVTTLLFMEQWPSTETPSDAGAADTPAGDLNVEPAHPPTLPARKFVVAGDYVHIDAKIITFADHFVAEGDPLRGRSLALFTGLYGSSTPPERAQPIDREGKAPRVYGGRPDLPSLDETRAKFEAELWTDFWRLVDEPEFAAGRGVEVAYGGGVWGALKPGFVYELTLENAGGLQLRSTPMPDIYRQLLREVQGVEASEAELAAQQLPAE